MWNFITKHFTVLKCCAPSVTAELFNGRNSIILKKEKPQDCLEALKLKQQNDGNFLFYFFLFPVKLKLILVCGGRGVFHCCFDLRRWRKSRVFYGDCGREIAEILMKIGGA
jgi:hypothetical protein